MAERESQREDTARGDEHRSMSRRVTTAMTVGSILEWYDFNIFGVAAALVFGQLFFPDFSPLAGTLAAFATYAIGFFARPVGAIILGNYGDKIGRRPILFFTLILMGIATALISVLPTFETIGIWAPVLLVALRLLQGLGASGEYVGALVMSSEHAPVGRRGLYGSWPVTGVYVGTILGQSVFWGAAALLSEEQLLSWGWRVPFLLGILVAGLGIYVRLRIEESPVFEEVKEAGVEARTPLLATFRANPKPLAIAVGGQVGVAYYYILQVFVLTYVADQLGLSPSIGLTGVVIANLIALVTTPTLAALSDRIGRRPVFMSGAAFAAVFAFPFFWLVNTEVPVVIYLALTLGIAFGMSAMFGVQGAFYSELFSSQHRFSSFALAREVTTAVMAGTAPFIGTALLGLSGGSPWPLALYMTLVAVIPLVAVYSAPETYRLDLTQEARTEAARKQREPSAAQT